MIDVLFQYEIDSPFQYVHTKTHLILVKTVNVKKDKILGHAKEEAKWLQKSTMSTYPPGILYIIVLLLTGKKT